VIQYRNLLQVALSFAWDEMEKAIKKEDRLTLLEQFLRIQEKLNKEFSKKEMADFTGYPVATITTYFGKYLINYLVHPSENKSFSSRGINKLSSLEFQTHMSQKSLKLLESKIDPKVEKLRQRSLDAFCLAVENYNRLTLRNRVEVFCILISNAWELLLKAELILKHGMTSINYSDSDRTLSLRDVAYKFFGENDLIRKNIELLAELRDQCIHLLIPELQPGLSRIFQASVINFRDCYKQYTDISPFPDQSLGLMSLVIDGEDLNQPLLLKEYGEITAHKVEEFLAKFKASEKTIDSRQLAIPVEYKLALTKKESNSDICLSVKSDSTDAIIVERAAPIEKTHPYRAKNAVSLINNKTSKKAPKLSIWSFRLLLSRYKMFNDPRYHNHEKISNTHSYSETTIEKFVHLLETNPEALTIAIEHQRNSKK
jgi:hypothetical protein